MLRVRIKTLPKDTECIKMTLKDFFRLYFRNLFNEMNSILSDYHSIQEHSNRSKLIEFVNKKQKDLDLLQIFVKGAYLSNDLNLMRFKSDDTVRAGLRIVEMADFIAILYENMKMSFIPVPNFDLSLQTHIDTAKLLPIAANQIKNEIEPRDFEEIHRMMRIYILKENLNNYSIENGVLIIKSDFFTFELALCGDFTNPQWHLYKVKSFLNHKSVEDQIQKRLKSIESICDFIRFYESRKRANDVFNDLDKKSGFYQNFAGVKNGLNFRGHLKDNEFICKIIGKDFMKDLISPTKDEINQVFDTLKKEPFEKTNKNVEEGKEFRSDIFGSNLTFIRKNMFFSLCKEKNVCYFGENAQICGLKFLKISLKNESSNICGSVSSKGCYDYVFGSNKRNLNSNLIDGITPAVMNSNTKSGMPNETVASTIFSTHLADFITFIDQNITFFEILLGIIDLSFTVEIKNSLIANFFKIDRDFNLFYNDQLLFSFSNSQLNLKAIIQKIRLLEIQTAFKALNDVIESKPGEKLSLFINGIKIVISNGFKTNLKFLTEDCQKFTINQALQYTINFGAFYLHNIYPDAFLVSKVFFCFVDLFNENVSVTIENGLFKIEGPNMLMSSKISASSEPNDLKMLFTLYKVWLANRFIAIKKEFDISNGRSRDDQIILKDENTILLTKEGLKYQSKEQINDAQINRALNTERSIWKYFK